MTTPVSRAVQQGDGYLPYVVQEITANSGPIFQVLGYKGGWERWLQIELARTVLSPNHLHVQCEESIWSDQAKVDLWTKSQTGAPNVGLELKCRTAIEQDLSFADRYHADMVKVTRQPKEANRPCYLYAIGITTVQADCTIQYNTVYHPITHLPVPIYYYEVVQGLYMLYTLGIGYQ